MSPQTAYAHGAASRAYVAPALAAFAPPLTPAQQAARQPKFRTPGELARAINPSTVQTAALELIDRAIVKAYNTRDARLIICLPPQEGKSTRVTQCGALWMLQQNPHLRIIIVSCAQDLADQFGGEIRNWIGLFNGEENTLDLGLRLAKDYGAKSHWRLATGLPQGGVLAVGLNGLITGRPGDALFIDDPVKNQEDADSLLMRNKAWSVWQAAASTRLAPGAPVIVVTTRWHEDDLAGRLQAAEDGHLWTVINIPALADHDPEKGQTDPLGRKPGQWLASARGRTVKEWEAIKVRSGSRVFSALYQGRPSPEVGNVWRRTDWGRFATPIWSYNPALECYTVPEADEVAQSWDFAFKDTKGSDFVAGQILARIGANVYVVDQVCLRLGFTDSIAAVRRMTAKWPQATAKFIEDKANGPAVMDSLKREIPGIVAVEPHGTKYARAVAVAPFIEAHNVWLPEAAIALYDVEGLIEEAAGFPNAAHDDQVDALSQGLDRMLLRSSDGEVFLAWMKQAVEAKRAREGEPAVA